MKKNSKNNCNKLYYNELKILYNIRFTSHKNSQKEPLCHYYLSENC